MIREELASFIGRTEKHVEVLHPYAVERLATLLGRDGPAPHTLPPLAHWLYFNGNIPLDLLGYDGHQRLGAFIPDLGLPKRMWAGGRIEFLAPARMGATARRITRLERVSEKLGRSGPMVFVTLLHEISIDDRVCIREIQDLVYREPSATSAAGVAPFIPPELLSQGFRGWRPDPVMLFRYSALTYNGHRIHYDADFARAEGHAHIVIHGPLLATFMMDVAVRHWPGLQPTFFKFRAVQPCCVGDTIIAHACRADHDISLWITRQDGTLAMSGSLVVANNS